MMPTDKRYGPRLGVTGMIIANAGLLLLLLHVLGVDPPAPLAIALIAVFFNAIVMLVHLQQRKYLAITLSQTHVRGYRFSWPAFARRLVMHEPVAIPRDSVDKERSARRTAHDRWNGFWSIWSRDGQRLRFSPYLLGKGQTKELLEALGITEESA